MDSFLGALPQIPGFQPGRHAQLIKLCLALVGDPFALVRDLLSLVGTPFALVGEPLAPVGDPVALVSCPLTPVFLATFRAGCTRLHTYRMLHYYRRVEAEAYPARYLRHGRTREFNGGNIMTLAMRDSA